MFSSVQASQQVLVGDSSRTRQLMRLIDKVGESRWPVLVLGETGTGKEVVAKSIYQRNPAGPFVTIDCSSLVGTIMESELFGHAKGAFTGAAGMKTGLIESADGGTAFFDEIGELPLEMQAKLLRVLQTKEFRPVGSLQSRRSDFRIIAATNRDLAKEVERGTFRRDLYYRLNVVSLKLPALRDRKDDVPLLVDHFLRLHGRGHRLAQEALDALVAYDWPGNVRELENCVQNMVAIHTGPLLTVSDLPSCLQNHIAARRAQSMSVAVGSTAPAIALPMPAVAPSLPQPMPVASSSSPFADRLASSAPVIPLHDVEKNAIVHALEYTRGDRGVAATLLGIGRTTLYRKLKEYQLAC
ncbi:MAG: sigma-54-dependent Fis family transcriptional regulator [Acidobacteria bacterium]|nr:sigma-54-dependent Fis family transcriptional regulator [Acidobacteriota bacterium]